MIGDNGQNETRTPFCGPKWRQEYHFANHSEPFKTYPGAPDGAVPTSFGFLAARH
jgi:hypothetical protein